MRAPLLWALLLLAGTAFPSAGVSFDRPTLPDMGPAPDFALISSDGAEFRLSSLRGKVVVVAFIYTWCPDVCPLLTGKMARVQEDLGTSFGKDVSFLSITVDPERDTAAVLRNYAETFDADPAGWFFLTGDVAAVRQVTADYGVLTIPGADSEIGHNLLTTLIDRHGRMRVQYAGHRFDPDELHQDLMVLMAED
jgi:protein SCO1/2